MKKFKNDIILIVSILVVAIVMLISLYACGQKDNLVAYVYHDNQLVLTIDLDTLEEDTIYTVEGDVSKVVIAASKSGVRVLEAGCTDEICMNQGIINNSAQTITCLPNKIVIILEGKEGVDVEV